MNLKFLTVAAALTGGSLPSRAIKIPNDLPRPYPWPRTRSTSPVCEQRLESSNQPRGYYGQVITSSKFMTRGQRAHHANGRTIFLGGHYPMSDLPLDAK